MDELPESPSLFISRFAFQLILHQALQSNPQSPCCGLLAAPSVEQCNIQYISSWDEAPADQDKKIVCVGFYHMLHHHVDAALLSALPATYVELVVNMDEKGRLDMVAYQCRLGSDHKESLPVQMIEDGQYLTDG